MINLNVLIFIILAAVPVIVAAKCLNKKENEHIPKKLIIKIIISEIILACIAAFAEEYVLANMVQNNIYTMLMANIIGIGMLEEIAKFIPAYFLGIKSENCKTFYAPVVLCGFSALAFAGFENILYLIEAKDLIGSGVIRGLLSITGHVMYGLIMGILISIAINYKKENKKFKYIINMIFCIIIPSIYHGIYDYALHSGNQLAITIIILFEAIVLIYVISIIKSILKDNNLDNKKISTFGIKNLVILVVLIVIIFGMLKYKGENFEYKDGVTNIGENIEISNEVNIIVNSVEEIQDENDGAKYVKINLTISNKGQEDFITIGSFELEKDNSEKISDKQIFSKSISPIVLAGENISGDLYFETDKSNKMKLIITKIDYKTAETKEYIINLK